MVLKKKQSSPASASLIATVEKATDDQLTGPDWGINLEICDIINNNVSLARDAVKAVKKRMNNKNTKVQLLALIVLEMVMKNCGELIHQLVAEKGIPAEMAKMVKKADRDVKNKILTLLDSWQQALSMQKYPQYFASYEDLRRAGVQFPEHDPGDTALFTTPSAHTITVPLNEARSNGGGKVNIVVTIAENPIVRDINDAQRGVEVLNDILNALDPNDNQAAHDELVTQLVDQCRINQKSITQLVNSTSDESLVCRILAVNDDLQQILERYETILVQSQPNVLSTMSHPVYDHDEEGESEDLSELTHRSRVKPDSGITHMTALANAQVSSPVESKESISGAYIPRMASVNGVNQTSSPELETLNTTKGLNRSTTVQVNNTDLYSSLEFDNFNTVVDSHSLNYVNNDPFGRAPSPLPRPESRNMHWDSNSDHLDTFTSGSSQLTSLPSTSSQMTSSSDKSIASPNYSYGDSDVIDQTVSIPAKKATNTSLPPPPSRFSERERYFEQKRQTYRNSGMKTDSGKDRLFEDLVDYHIHLGSSKTYKA